MLAAAAAAALVAFTRLTRRLGVAIRHLDDESLM